METGDIITNVNGHGVENGSLIEIHSRDGNERVRVIQTTGSTLSFRPLRWHETLRMWLTAKWYRFRAWIGFPRVIRPPEAMPVSPLLERMLADVEKMKTDALALTPLMTTHSTAAGQLAMAEQAKKRYTVVKDNAEWPDIIE